MEIKSIQQIYTESCINTVTSELRLAVFNYLFTTRPASPEARKAVYSQVVKDMVESYYADPCVDNLNKSII